ncbi:DUF551 domain-containing protein [Bacteroides ovatus]|jgi:hypothetical protein|uniref:DUF551 domain-containing protein n=1 Tax=Bacteroides ovatus TaxID=28116 RepID=UPI001F1C5B59|nr:DUF551 domain-containing protein [Bacteroides ovatus]MCE8977184.1 DUF551 domain-containing protein [Bacteroides ovatus]
MKQTLEEAAIKIAEDCYEMPYDENFINMKLIKNAFEFGAEWHARQPLWISVEERLPNPLEEVILYDNKSIQHYAVGWLRKDKGYNKSMWCVTNGFVEDKYITHWSPIPALPKGGEE